MNYWREKICCNAFKSCSEEKNYLFKLSTSKGNSLRAFPLHSLFSLRLYHRTEIDDSIGIPTVRNGRVPPPPISPRQPTNDSRSTVQLLVVAAWGVVVKPISLVHPPRSRSGITLNRTLRYSREVVHRKMKRNVNIVSNTVLLVPLGEYKNELKLR